MGAAIIRSEERGEGEQDRCRQSVGRLSVKPLSGGLEVLSGLKMARAIERARVMEGRSEIERVREIEKVRLNECMQTQIQGGRETDIRHLCLIGHSFTQEHKQGG